MLNSQFKGLARQALRLNMQYYGGLFDVTRDYLVALRKLADEGSAPDVPVNKPAPKAAAPAIPPLVLAAPAGKQASASFAVTNTTGQEVAADPEVSENLKKAGVIAEPAGRMVAAGQDAIFTLKAKPSGKMPVETDLHGTVSVPHFGDREIPVVLRRLPPDPAVSKPKRKSAARKNP
ncbi:hypothetical protein [uncultured Roseobacter sp.]|uniref:hypothetical protein n=1 Tax=uncultured Roseobacter sp. TaxID=114847 RepID=UPI002610E5A0|nr:hypothetical protein [uncultured Roseobacter sp.]